ncbi:MAG: hypothetical protein CFH41_02575 [Alphaproteobacteria bacterium MarineAlpha11_Bin1]|nr:MAG: hypothetical protein CFH41_02575 [Alphaproteobacteria bacterium MarineAlpha11_Bin1]|tara:strand:- start:239 stop:448 length:210 start_codon:yes stop_codon:yes gene_type:complete
MEYLGPYFKDLITLLPNWMREDSVGPALAGMITIAGILVLVVLISNFIYDQIVLNRAIAIIGDRDQEAA